LPKAFEMLAAVNYNIGKAPYKLFDREIKNNKTAKPEEITHSLIGFETPQVTQSMCQEM